MHLISSFESPRSRGTTQDGFTWYFFSVFFESIIFGFVVAIFDLVHDVEAIFHLP